jgi:hypothetical protein
MNVQQRIRDQKRNFKPQQNITFEEWTNISDRALTAKNFLKDTNPIYLAMKESVDYAKKLVLENRIHEVREEHTISENLKKIFVTPQKVQVDELVGQIKFVEDLFSELNSWIDLKKELEKKEADGSIVIDRRK